MVGQKEAERPRTNRGGKATRTPENKTSVSKVDSVAICWGFYWWVNPPAIQVNVTFKLKFARSALSVPRKKFDRDVATSGDSEGSRALMSMALDGGP